METPQKKRIKLSIPSIESMKEKSTTDSNMKEIFTTPLQLNSSDFSKIVTTTGFIDKTLLIKSLFESTCKVLLTAPRRFGKSTNIDMVKRFLEIEVDSSGRPINASTTFNYKLFSENKLKIFEHEQFCKQHLGKHPVMIIDYNPLSEVENFESMLSQYKLILKRTFEHHHYLLGVDSIWSGNSNIDKFKCYINADNHSIDMYDLKCGFIFLAEILHKYFGKPVFLLIDNYDAYFKSFMFKNNTDMSRIINFIQSTTADLLKSSNHIDHAMFTGVVRFSNEGLPLTFSQYLNGITHYEFLDKHPFCTYFGLTSKELSKFLNIFIKDERMTEKCKRTINKYFNGYEIINKNIKIYNIWSVLQFFENNRKIKSHFSRDDYIFSIKSIFSVDKVVSKIFQLLLGKCVEVDSSKQFSKTNIMNLNNIINSIDYNPESSDDLLFLFLLKLGYLSIAEVKNKSTILLKIPNQEVFFQFAKLLKESYEIKYNFDPEYIENFQSVSNSFRQTQMTNENFVSFCKSLNDLLINSTYLAQTLNEISSIMFIFLGCKFSFIKAGRYTSDTFKGFITINDHDVALFIHSEMLALGSNETIEEIAEKTHNQLFNKDNFDLIEKNIEKKLRGKIYIAVYSCINKKLAISYSFLFKKLKIVKPVIIQIEK